jgi:hypothetical protein
MTKPISVPNVFAAQTGNIPLSQLDSDFTTAYNAINDTLTYSNYVIDTGASNAYVVTFPANITVAYTAGFQFQMKITNSNSGASTINVNGLGIKNITRTGSLNLDNGDLAAGAIVTLLYDGTNFQIVGPIPRRSVYSVRGLLAANNTATPNTKFDMSADIVALRNASTGETVAFANTGTITCDTGFAGPAANGRDQAGAFSASTWLHFYFISTGAVINTIVSLTAPPTGPTLPSGYTYWAYVGAVRYDAVPALASTRIFGSMALYTIDGGSVDSRALSAGNSTIFTAVAFANFIPPNSTRVYLNNQLSFVHNAANVTVNLQLRPTGASAAAGVQAASIQTQVANNTNQTNVSGWFDTGTTQQIDYKVTIAASGGSAAYIDVLGYMVPNGG